MQMGGMITRRQLMGSAMVLPGLALGHGMAMNPPLPGVPAARVRRVLIDERFALSRCIAQRLFSPSAVHVPLPRDLLGFWHQHLAPACGCSPRAVAGVTTERGFFLLQTLAADRRLRVQRVWSQTTTADVNAKLDTSLVAWAMGPAGTRI
jgi:hypothetical protein